MAERTAASDSVAEGDGPTGGVALDACTRLAALEAAGRQRRLRDVTPLDGPRVRCDGRELVSFASCDYLGLARHPRLAEAAARAARELGTSAGSARLLVGHGEPVAELEEALARWFGAPSALVFGSGYLANVGLVTALAGPGDLILSDALNHASTVDACRLSGAEVAVLPHGDLAAVEAALERAGAGRRVLVLAEGVYSMDGDLAPLGALAALCQAHGAWLLVDDAHGLGVVGPGGRGTAAALCGDRRPAAQVGNLGKALGSYGAFVLAEEPVRELLLQTARTFVFTCALPPTVVAAAREALAVLDDEPERVQTLQSNSHDLRSALSGFGLIPAAPAAELAGHAGALSATIPPIVPVVVGDGARALELSERLARRGWLVPAVRPPTVPEGGARLRLTVTAQHTPDECRRLAVDLAEEIHD